MMMEPNEHAADLRAWALGADLRHVSRANDLGAGSLDRAVLGLATMHFAEIRRGRQQVRRARWSRMAAAAALAMTAAIALWLSVPRAAVHHVASDITRDGVVDILDAFALARNIESGAMLPASFDFDGSGRVDQRDADALAARVVSVTPASPIEARASRELSWEPQS
jgi:hypothetical protein